MALDADSGVKYGASPESPPKSPSLNAHERSFDRVMPGVNPSSSDRANSSATHSPKTKQYLSVYGRKSDTQSSGNDIPSLAGQSSNDIPASHLSELFRFQSAYPRPGLAALAHACVFLLLGFTDLFCHEIETKVAVVLASLYLAVATLPLACVLWRNRIHHPPQLALAHFNLMPMLRLASNLFVTSCPCHDELAAGLLKVAALNMLSTILFPAARRVKIVCWAVVSGVLFVAIGVAWHVGEYRPGGKVLLEASLLYIVLAAVCTLAWNPDDGLERGSCKAWKNAIREASKFKTCKEPVCWDCRQLFKPIFEVSDVIGERQNDRLRQQFQESFDATMTNVGSCCSLDAASKSSLREAMEAMWYCFSKSYKDSGTMWHAGNQSAEVRDWVDQNMTTPKDSPLLPSGDPHQVADQSQVARHFMNSKELAPHSLGAGIKQKAKGGTSTSTKQEVKDSSTDENMNAIGEGSEEGLLSFIGNVRAMAASFVFCDKPGTCDAPQPVVKAIMQNFGKWDFDVLGFSRVVGTGVLEIMGMTAMRPLLDQVKVQADGLHLLLQNIEKRYHGANTYHNNLHGADVLNALSYMVSAFTSSGFVFSDTDKFTALLAACAHDMGHDGNSNHYHISTATPLALLYNDQSVLENLHASIFFTILRSQGCDIFSDWQIADRQAFRRMALRMILDTDLAKYFGQNKLFRENYIDVVDPLDPHDLSPQQCQDLFSFALRLSDVGGSAKTFSIHVNWAVRVNAEFFSQGDLEKQLSMPCSSFCDRDVHKIADSQLGFFDFIACPLYQCLADFIEQSMKLELQVHANLKFNRQFWSTYENEDFDYQDPLSSIPNILKSLKTPRRLSPLARALRSETC
eukprot:TRINITY_DN6321_c0_g2_i1.p1 TRINITY_DN6321_c0_g2~~TRINITY_DN6321_c0_g2_i1.p1  ORF type:complete len:856 (-),score=123.43 TRINITY_DN6321_c0_g2_i1:82-2649(-)